MNRALLAAAVMGISACATAQALQPIEVTVNSYKAIRTAFVGVDTAFWTACEVAHPPLIPKAKCDAFWQFRDTFVPLAISTDAAIHLALAGVSDGGVSLEALESALSVWTAEALTLAFPYPDGGHL